MIRIASAIFLTFCIYIFAQQEPRAQFNGCPAGFCSLVAPTGGGSTYTGPGDIFAFVTWGGFRAYNAATAGTKAINVCDSATGLTCADWLTDASTGALVPTNIGGSPCSSIACELATIYDKVGALDVVRSHAAGRMAVTANALNTSYCATTSSSTLAASVSSLVQAQPLSASIIYKRTGAFTSFDDYLFVNNLQIGGNNAANQTYLYTGGSVGFATASDSAFHAINDVANASGSKIVVDGSSNSVGIGSTTGTNGVVTIGTSAGAAVICEVGIANGDQSALFATLNTNQHAAYGSW